MTTLDFTQHQTQAKFAGEVNEGYTGFLHGIKLEDCPYFPNTSEPAQAWQHGWRMAAQVNKAKR